MWGDGGGGCVCVCVCVCASARACVANMLICLVSFHLLLIYLCSQCYNTFLYIICLSITNVIFFSIFLFLFYIYVIRCSFAFSIKDDSVTIHSHHIFCALNTDSSYNRFLCGEQ